MDVASKNIRELGIDLKNEYNSLSGTDEIRMLQGLQSIIDLQSKKRDLKSFLREVAMIIHRVAPFKEVSIGIRSPSDGLFRYIEVLGITPIAKAEHSKLSYTYEQMFNQESYPFLRISKLTDFRYGAENGTEIVEKDAFSRPSLLKIPRKSKTEMLEADYFDIYLFDQKDNLIGWK